MTLNFSHTSSNKHRAMAQILHLYLLATLLLALSFKATSSSRHSGNNGLKSLHFALYQHETINKTGYIIVNGVAGAGVGQTTTPFGTLFAFQDPMTVTANISSKVVAIAEGTSITSSFDGLRSISIAKITLRLKNHMGSISVVGGTHNIKPADHPVVGGTGDFMFVQGYVTSSPVDLRGLTVTYKIVFHLYWPSYANKFSLHDKHVRNDIIT
ncbi:dirigent protein 11-like [Populus nigra]|uniref:dirigent protein 11-like n=1 Tax=Populus nigra TaxID=3691 RepID=UPI002B276F03|nr:dirigent protein 11-like [Populus nigra]